MHYIRYINSRGVLEAPFVKRLLLSNGDLSAEMAIACPVELDPDHTGVRKSLYIYEIFFSIFVESSPHNLHFTLFYIYEIKNDLIS